ncbi:winged helix-turn-helix domain-containing protein, partial [Streptomyces anthocyanicus]|uniref:winged helix-turn-helix domain-containing protein n=1 Tax=Streptomyces anthocyanicus TaxID=68174 RepID=UPI003653FCDD
PELLLRLVLVQLRGLPAPVDRTTVAYATTVDPSSRRAAKDGVELALTLREFDLLAFFLRHPGRAYAREDLMREVWGWDFGDLSTVTVHVRRLRGKVEDDPAHPRLIQTVWGVGYRFAAPEGAVPARADQAAPAAGRTVGPHPDSPAVRQEEARP